MSRTYKAVGINLKGMALGESDRLLTILTPEFGLVRAVAPGARKHNSSLSGRSGLFVVNELLIAKGRSLDKITQAETIESYPGLSKDLGKLAASQYIAEIVLCQALSEQPQTELFSLLNEHLRRFEQLPKSDTTLVLAHLAHAIFHLLALSGITPEVQACCVTRQILTPDLHDPQWQVGFSVPAGGIINLAAWEQLQAQSKSKPHLAAATNAQLSKNTTSKVASVAEAKNTNYQTIVHQQQVPALNLRINAPELTLLQHLAASKLPTLKNTLPNQPESLTANWEVIEQVLRQYTQYHLGRPIRSAALIDSYLASYANVS